MYSMPHCSDGIGRMAFTEKTMNDPWRNWTTKDRKCTMWKLFSDIENEDEDINTSSNGRDIRSPKHRGNRKDLYPFPIDYSSESFAPLVRSDRQIAHVKYLLRGNHAAVARFRHYLTTCATIFTLEKTITDLQNSRDHVFEEFVTPDVVRRLQPFLIQTRRRSQAPPSTTIISNIRRQQELPPIPTFPLISPTITAITQPTPAVRLPHASHDNIPIVVPTPSVTPTVVRPDAPIPPPLVIPQRYVSPLLPNFDPCPNCGSADGTHFRECTL